MSDWRDDRIGAARRGENPMVMARMRSGFAVIADTQFLPGYSVLLTEDESAEHLTDLSWSARRDFLFDMSLLGEAIASVCGPQGLVRMNYELLGNSLRVVHAHVIPRYRWEPAERLSGPVWRYANDEIYAEAVEYDADRHGEMRAGITSELTRLMTAAY